MSDRYEPRDPNTQLYFLSKKFKEWSSIAAVVISLIALVVVGVQTCHTKREADAAFDAAKAAQDAVRQSRESFQRDQRPYVWLTNDLGKPEFVQKAGTHSGQAIWDWHFTNYGKTPALGIRFRQYFKVGNEFHPAPGSNEQTGFGSPLPPTKVNFSTNVSEPISVDDFRRSLDTDQGIGIRIVLEYMDANGGKYESGFCLERLRTSAITYCSTGNYMK
jgi:hypothetical protein